MNEEVMLSQLSVENVRELLEEDVFKLLMGIPPDMPKADRIYYENIINLAFEFRTVSSKSRSLKGDLSMMGYKFFVMPNNSKMSMGVRRKTR